MSDDTTARVCVHGGLRRQCEACDLADRLEVAEAEVRRVQQEQDRQRIARIEAIEQGNSLAQRLIEQRDDARAERDAARAANQNAHECLFETEQSLSEARRVLRAQDECMVCKAELFRDLTVPHCFDCVVEDEHAEEWDAICAAKAAVLAQEVQP